MNWEMLGASAFAGLCFGGLAYQMKPGFNWLYLTPPFLTLVWCHSFDWHPEALIALFLFGLGLIARCAESEEVKHERL